MAASNIPAQACLTLGGCSRHGVRCEGPVELDTALQLQDQMGRPPRDLSGIEIYPVLDGRVTPIFHEPNRMPPPPLPPPFN
jgi:hypothetical protein